MLFLIVCLTTCILPSKPSTILSSFGRKLKVVFATSIHGLGSFTKKKKLDPCISEKKCSNYNNTSRIHKHSSQNNTSQIETFIKVVKDYSFFIVLVDNENPQNCLFNASATMAKTPSDVNFASILSFIFM